jgi:hypothetical protein
VSLIQVSSTVGSSRYGWKGPNPATDSSTAGHARRTPRPHP